MKTLLSLLLAATFLFLPFSVPAQTPKNMAQRHPDVIDVRVTARGGDRFDFEVTLSSPYDTEQRYADAFRVIGADGKTLGERILFHDHADEQPFSRKLNDVAIPPTLRKVTVQGRDQKFGYGGKTMELVLPGR